MVKFIVVTGGVISGIGKGITASSIGVLLQARGLVVTAIKIDPYINVDAGTMSPYEHGECFVLDDGGEVDLDLGNYERFITDLKLTSHNSITTGKVYKSVIEKERRGEYLGKTVQIIPHITDEIQRMIMHAAEIPVNNQTPDVCIIEIGGTVGDIETMPFIEAIRQMSYRKKNNICFVHVSMIVMAGCEEKTKPTQESVSKLRSLGIIPNFLIIRTSNYLNPQIIDKLETFCHIPADHMISNINVDNIYFVPNVFEKQELGQKINEKLCLCGKDKKKFNHFESIVNYYSWLKINNPIKKEIVIAGKYVGCQDTYLSLLRAIEHATFKTFPLGNVEISIKWLDTEKYNGEEINADAIIIPGGFGSRGIQGKIAVANYARTMKIPMLGICLGMQIMVVEYAQNVCRLDATSSEWLNESEDKVIDILPDQTGTLGGTMRLGLYPTYLKEGSLAKKIYNNETVVYERHRHRYEVNNKYVSILEEAGLYFTGTNENKTLMEMVELDQDIHPFYVGCQFHPEYTTKHNQPHPLFCALISSGTK